MIGSELPRAGSDFEALKCKLLAKPYEVPFKISCSFVLISTIVCALQTSAHQSRNRRHEFVWFNRLGQV